MINKKLGYIFKKTKYDLSKNKSFCNNLKTTYIHIHKCGGSSVRTNFKNLLNFQIESHSPLSFYYDPRKIYITTIRKPKEFYISFYNYHKFNPNSRYYQLFNLKKNNFDEFLKLCLPLSNKLDFDQMHYYQKIQWKGIESFKKNNTSIGFYSFIILNMVLKNPDYAFRIDNQQDLLTFFYKDHEIDTYFKVNKKMTQNIQEYLNVNTTNLEINKGDNYNNDYRVDPINLSKFDYLANELYINAT